MARELSREEYLSLAPSDRAHYAIKGNLGEFPGGDTESTKSAREAAFGEGSDEKAKSAKPDPSSVSLTRSPKPDEGPAAAAEGKPSKGAKEADPNKQDSESEDKTDD